jgi:hypothetical protein
VLLLDPSTQELSKNAIDTDAADRRADPIKVNRRPILQYCSQKRLKLRLTRHCRYRVIFLFPNKAAKATPRGAAHASAKVRAKF